MLRTRLVFRSECVHTHLESAFPFAGINTRLVLTLQAYEEAIPPEFIARRRIVTFRSKRTELLDIPPEHIARSWSLSCSAFLPLAIRRRARLPTDMQFQARSRPIFEFLRVLTVSNVRAALTGKGIRVEAEG